MSKFVRLLLAGAALTGMSALAWAGAVGDFGQPHLVTITVPKTQHNTSFPNGRDSIAFTLESSASLRSLAAYYDSAAVTDTLAPINLENNSAWTPWGFTPRVGTAGSGDSVFVGRLTLNLDPATSTLGSADSFYVFADISFDGINWISQAGQPSLGTHGALLRIGALSGGTIKGGSANVIARDLYSLNAVGTAGGATGMVANQTICKCYGAKALRFRLLVAQTMKRMKVLSATWTQLSNGPDKGR